MYQSGGQCQYLNTMCPPNMAWDGANCVFTGLQGTNQQQCPYNTYRNN